MHCPHCKKDTFTMYKIWLWPFGVKTCRACHGQSKIKKRPLLTLISLLLGLMAWIPPIVFNNLWYLIPSTVLILIIDYTMDKKYRELVNIRP